TNITVQLQAAGSVTGAVFAADGTTPVANMSVQLAGQVTRQIKSGVDGSFRFDGIPINSYLLSAIDSTGDVRSSSNISLTLQGQLVTQNLVLSGAGTVTGTVFDPTGSPLPGVAVVVQPVNGRNASAITNVNGSYLVSQIPIGNFNVSASFPSGAVQDGKNQMFAGDSGLNRGGMLLDVISSGVPTRFTGQGATSSNLATTELSGRQFVIQQNGLDSLNVTRKVYVPSDGYFARYLDIVSNPNGLPVTVDLKLTSNFRFVTKAQNGFSFNREPRIISTSSGDALLSVSDPTNRDFWVVVDDDEDGDPFSSSTNMP